MTDIKDDDWVFLPLKDATDGPTHGFCQVYSQRWWSVHPELGLRFYNPKNSRGKRWQKGLGSPQCNSDMLIMRQLGKTGDLVMYFDRVFVPVDINDWRD